MNPPASISLDLDNLWSYMKIHGDAGWDDYPSYLDTLVDLNGGATIHRVPFHPVRLEIAPS